MIKKFVSIMPYIRHNGLGYELWRGFVTNLAKMNRTIGKSAGFSEEAGSKP